MAWSSIITGANPAEHGIFGFTDFAPGTYRMTFPNFASLKAPAFWERDGEGRSVIVNVPATYPARELNGVLIAGFVALNLEKATYPQSWLPYLQDNAALSISVDGRISAGAEETLGQRGAFSRIPRPDPL